MKLLVGLAAAAAATYLLRSDKGKAIISSLDKQAGGFGKNLSKMAGDLLKKGTRYGAQGAETVQSVL